MLHFSPTRRSQNQTFMTKIFVLFHYSAEVYKFKETFLTSYVIMQSDRQYKTTCEKDSKCMIKCISPLKF